MTQVQLSFLKELFAFWFGLLYCTQKISTTNQSYLWICEFAGYEIFSNFKIELLSPDLKNLSITVNLPNNKKVLFKRGKRRKNWLTNKCSNYLIQPKDHPHWIEGHEELARKQYSTSQCGNFRIFLQPRFHVKDLNV